MIDFDALIDKLEAWTDHSFHADRQLSDEVLLADGWQCEDDGGRVKWSRKFGSATSSIWEPHHPHPLQDLNAAFALRPYGTNINTICGQHRCQAAVYVPLAPFEPFIGESPELTVAICIASLKAIKAKAAPNG